MADDPTPKDIAAAIAKESNCDVLFYNGPIVRPADEYLIRECIRRRRRPNLLLLLITEGGDADAGYRITRCLQDKYENFTVYICGYCKSAGTLIALGANEIVMSDHGELGPLDIQMPKKDEIWDVQSGLTVMSSLEALKEKTYLAFEDFFLRIIASSGGTITVKTAADIASRLSDGLFSPISKQIDPYHLGEATRSVRIASNYGRRLLFKTDNYTNDSLEILVSGYPSHGFVIDRQEATMLFSNVRDPTEMEESLPESLGDDGRQPRRIDAQVPLKPEHVFEFFTDEPVEEPTVILVEDDEQTRDESADGGKPRPAAKEAGGHLQEPAVPEGSAPVAVPDSTSEPGVRRGDDGKTAAE